MTKSTITDTATPQAILDYIATLLPGIGVVVMLFDLDAQMMRPTTNLDPDDVIELIEQMVQHMKDTKPHINPKSSIQ